MKLDLNSAWESAVKLVRKNREMVLVLAGVFFFLPYVVFSLFVPMDGFAMAAESGDRAAMIAAFNAFAADYWWAVLLLSLIQTIGATAIMAVIGDPARPTVNDAMTRGLTLLPSQIGAQIISSFALLVIFMLAVLLGSLGGSGAMATTFGILTLPVLLYLWARFSLSAPTVAIDRQFNSFRAVTSSWRLTRGSGMRLFAFYLLLLVAFFVVGQVLGLLISLFTALPGEELARILDAVLSGLLNASFAVIIYAVFAAVHRQLAQAARVRSRDPMP